MDATIAGTIEDFYANQNLQTTLAQTGGILRDASDLVPGVSVDFSSTQATDPISLIEQTISGMSATLPGMLGAPGSVSSALQNSICALFPSLCGPGSALQSTTATKATLLTGACPPGKVIRHKKFARDICIKKPRMNPLNPHALRRATRRLAGFQHFAVRTEKAIQHSFRKAGVAPRHYSAPRRGRCTTCRKSSCGGC